ncbi:hypothetical protein AC249_AIPGENE17476 [Exaiptasia diaphana]|nr:hypothetical protein AC249_AIPGENE17476 [Exaiptasia diaphana]
MLKAIDPNGVDSRKAHKLKRRVYHSLGPNSAWHADGYDKLKPYGFPIHACIDGFSRKVIWLYVTRSNNYPDNIASYYLDAVKQLGGCPRELDTDLGTENDSFIMALRRFISRRGQVQVLYSDNGTNLVGGSNELKMAISEWNQAQVHDYLLQREIEWHFNPPAASHFGGVWERCIRTVRKTLCGLTQEQVLDDESMPTLMAEVEAIVNGRPLTTVSSDPTDDQALTPNHLLLLNQEPSLPPGIFDEHDIYSRKRWRQIQYLTNLFWRRWTKEYLPALQQRVKWQQPRRNFCVDDLVLIADPALPRNTWMMGRIAEVYPDRTGKVRQAKVKTKTGMLTRPISKLCWLESQ